MVYVYCLATFELLWSKKQESDIVSMVFHHRNSFGDLLYISTEIKGLKLYMFKNTLDKTKCEEKSIHK